MTFSSGLQVDMSNIIDQAQKIIEANGFKDSEWCNSLKLSICNSF